MKRQFCKFARKLDRLFQGSHASEGLKLLSIARNQVRVQHRYTSGRVEMRTTTLACLLLLGIGSSVHAQGLMIFSQVSHNEDTRTYRLYVPSTYQPDTPSPLMFLLHGLGQPFWHFEGQASMNSVAEEHGFLLAYPDARDRDWLRGDDNIGFIAEAALNDISSRYSIDPARVYTAGMSQGGNMSYRLAEARPDLFAAIASVTGVSSLVPEEPIPTLQIHGTADSQVSYSSATRMIEKMATVNGCESSSRSVQPRYR